MTVHSSTHAHVSDSNLHGLTNMQKVFVVAASVAVAVATAFALISLGNYQAVGVGALAGFGTLTVLSEYFRARMMKLDHKKFSQWALFPKGFFTAIYHVKLHKTHKAHAEVQK